MSEQRTQVDLLRDYFDRGGSLTVLEAIQPPFRCYALSQRCGELKRDGYPVHGEMVEVGNGKRVKRYSKGQVQLLLEIDPLVLSSNL